MLAELVAIGNEVLCGKAVNTNAAFISRKLEDEGVQVVRQTTIPDDHDIIIETLSESLACVPLVIATGGLGPTLDDITRNAVAELFESEMTYDEKLAEALQKRWGDFSTRRDQATVPKKALILENKRGTASGLIFYNGKSTLVLLPGVPLEMEGLMEDDVLPYIRKTFSIKSQGYQESLHFTNLFESSVDNLLREGQERFPDLKIGIYPDNSLLTLKLTGERGHVLTLKDQILKELGDHEYVSDDGKIETAIYRQFTEKKLTLAFAESCTGGALSYRMTKLPGVSQFFLGSLITYSNALKKELLAVPESLLNSKGAVSPEVSAAMAEGLSQKTGADFIVAVTGIAGPDGGTPEKPVGTVFVAIQQKGKSPRVFHLKAQGSRVQIIERTVNFALGELYHLVFMDNGR